MSPMCVATTRPARTSGATHSDTVGFTVWIPLPSPFFAERWQREMNLLFTTAHPNFNSMRLIYNVLAALLVIAVVTASMADHALLIPAASSGAPSECHQNMPYVPSSQAVTHTCCQFGHNSAILQTGRVAELSTAHAITSHVLTVPVQMFMPEPFNSGATPLGSPPSSQPLRI